VRRGEAYSEPTAESLDSLVELRVHFDTTDERTGALQLIPASQLWRIVPDAK
jgi:ectoine hydroxylase-related dioxygenase (phytanoyl-CoA dioxygenase family)